MDHGPNQDQTKGSNMLNIFHYLIIANLPIDSFPLSLLT